MSENENESLLLLVDSFLQENDIDIDTNDPENYQYYLFNYFNIKVNKNEIEQLIINRNYDIQD